MYALLLITNDTCVEVLAQKFKDNPKVGARINGEFIVEYFKERNIIWIMLLVE